MQIAAGHMRCVRPGQCVRISKVARPSSAFAVRAPLIVARASKAATKEVPIVEGLLSREDEDEEEEKFVHDTPHPVVDSKQVEAFLRTIVNETDIAEVKLQVGSFHLNVRRSKSAFPAPAPAPVYAEPVAIPAPLASMEPTAEETVDESLVYVHSPKVGIFRRGKYAGGKRLGKDNLVKEGDQIKKGQALGYVEQLGTHFPVEAPQAGEAVKFLVEEGAPVEYQQMVVEIAPFFGGHIIGDNKFA